MILTQLLPNALISSIETHFMKAQAVSNKEVRRLFHGRSGAIPGFSQLVVDWLPDIIVLRLYDEIDSQHLAALIRYFSAWSQVTGIVVQERGRGRDTKCELVYGECDNKLVVAENGLAFQVEPLQNQNFGLFLDMRIGRQWLRERSSGKRVLNLFAYTCAFSVAAVAGGAELVVNVDLSKSSLASGRKNHQLNNHDKHKVQFMPYDMLKSWSRIKKPGPYDIVIIDPPSFQPGSFVAKKDYAKVLRRLDQLTCENAMVMLCHNDPQQTSQFIKELMSIECPNFIYQQRLAVPDDFYEENIEKSLKVMIYQKANA